MLPLRLFALRNFSVTNIETFSVYGGLVGVFFFLVLFLQQLAGYSPFRAGPHDAAGHARHVRALALRRPATRCASGRASSWRSGPLIAGASAVVLMRLPTHLDYWTDLLPPLLGFSLGLSLTVAPLTTTVLSDAGPSDAGVASGVNNAVARVAGLFAIAVIGIAAASGTARLTEHGFHVAMLVTGALMCAGGVIGAVGIRNPKTA